MVYFFGFRAPLMPLSAQPSMTVPAPSMMAIIAPKVSMWMKDGDSPSIIMPLRETTAAEAISPTLRSSLRTSLTALFGDGVPAASSSTQGDGWMPSRVRISGSG